MIGTTFRMAQNDMAASNIDQHLGGDIAGMGPLLLPMAILCAQMNSRTGQNRINGPQQCYRGAYQNIAGRTLSALRHGLRQGGAIA
jgi:hypothetical protein